MKLNLLQWLVATSAIVALAWLQRHQPWTLSRIAGAVVCVVAFLLVSVARYQLGRAFSITAQARRLVTTGLYTWLRNPIYLFAELFLLGLALDLQSWWPVLIFAVAIPLQAVRARREAAVLQDAFGEEYTRYRARTWF